MSKMSAKKLQEKVHLLRDLERQYDALGSHIENLKDEIKAEMTNRGVSSLLGDDYKVSWEPYKSSRFDQSAFKVDHPDLYQSYRCVYESRRFSVK